MRLNTKYEILTPSGWQPFRGVTKTDSRHSFFLRFSNGKSLHASPSHKFVSGVVKTVENLTTGDLVQTVTGFTAIVEKTEAGFRDLYDIVECGDSRHQFLIESSIITKNCDEFAFVRPNMATEFWTSVQPVLSTGGSCIITSTPKSDEDQFAQIWRGALDNLDEYGQPLPNGRGKNDFFPIKVAWDAHPDRDETWAKPFRNSLGPAKFAQEFECVTGDTKLDLLDITTGEEIRLTMDQLTGKLRIN